MSSWYVLYKTFLEPIILRAHEPTKSSGSSSPVQPTYRDTQYYTPVSYNYTENASNNQKDNETHEVVVIEEKENSKGLVGKTIIEFLAYCFLVYVIAYCGSDILKNLSNIEKVDFDVVFIMILLSIFVLAVVGFGILLIWVQIKRYTLVKRTEEVVYAKVINIEGHYLHLKYGKYEQWVYPDEDYNLCLGEKVKAILRKSYYKNGKCKKKLYL
jgi:hypothetical protein